MDIRCATMFTLLGVRDMTNRKPYRTKAQKRLAKQHSYKAPDGTYRVNHALAPVSYHKSNTKG